jgi:hypothetical protein
MTATKEKLPKPQGEVLRTLGVRTLKMALAAWVLASLLFAHGCHRHEDNELFANLFGFGIPAATRGR